MAKETVKKTGSKKSASSKSASGKGASAKGAPSSSKKKSASKTKGARKKRRIIIFGIEIVLLLVLVVGFYVVRQLDRLQRPVVDPEQVQINKTLPEEIDWDSLYGNDNYWTSYESQYRDNRTLLMQLYIGNMSNLNYQLNGNFGEPVTYIGFPTESGKGSYISANQSFVLSAKSANLDGAWEFVRYYLTDEYQKELEWGMAVNKQVFMEQSQKALQKPTYRDENGNEIEYEDTFYINGEEIPLPPLSQEQLDQVINFVLSVDRAYYYNEDVLNIVNEEMGAFYTGQKSARDVANVIQSRAQIFVDENR